MTFLVAARRDVDAGIAARLFGRARGLERVDAAERAVEPAGLVLRLEMRAGERLARRPRCHAEHVADAVDRRLEPGLRASLGEPVPRRDILGRKGRAVDAGLVGAELRSRGGRRGGGRD